jgi:hypothetical protein
MGAKESFNKALATFIVCCLTALFAGITVWSINGLVTTVIYSAGYDYITTAPVDSATQGLLAFITIGLLFISISLLVSIQIDRLKTKP